MKNQHPPEFDFDYWSQLARRDPSAFFAQRQQMIEDFIASAPIAHQQSLRSTQRLIDATRAEAGSPMQAVRMMMGMLADHLDALQGQFDQLRTESGKIAVAVEKLRDL